jgi:hypothetical protein
MNEVAVHFAVDHMDAEVAASALRAAGLHPRIVLDNSIGGVTGITPNIGRRVVYVPAVERRRAQEILEEPVREEPEDNPVLRMVVIVALITGLLLATPFVAQACSPSL